MVNETFKSANSLIPKELFAPPSWVGACIVPATPVLRAEQRGAGPGHKLAQVAFALYISVDVN
jgi:hypothetical protein